MEEKEFVSLVERLEIYAQKHPAAYKFRVAVLAALGYLILVGSAVGVILFSGVLIFVMANVASIAVLYLLLIPIGAGTLVLRSMWVEFPKPEGYELRSFEAPRLFEMLNRIRNATKGPELHHVLLTPDLNAAIIQRPRWGIFGRYENYLVVGLPLLHALSPDEVRAVIAHEFGHLSRKHGAASGWIYRVRQTWIQVLVNMQGRRNGAAFFYQLYKWYAPYFSAYSFVLSRAKEFEADRFAVVLAGKQNAARALIKTELKQRALDEEFWPTFFGGAETQSDVPQDVFIALLAWMREPVTSESAQRWFAQSLTHTHHYTDSHPALGDRLEAVGYKDVRLIADLDLFDKNSSQYGDEYFLKRVPSDLIDSWNADSRENLGERWEALHKAYADSKRGLANLGAKAQIRELTLDERLDQAKLMARVHGKAAIIPQLQEILAIEPDHATANFVLGEALLEKGDEAGIKYIERTMEIDVYSVPVGCETIFQFLAGKRRQVEGEKYRSRAKIHQEKLERAHEERNTIKETDRFKSHGVAPDVLMALRKQLARYSDLASAHLVQKVVKNFPEKPSYVLGITRKRAWHESQDNNLDLQLIKRLVAEVSFPGFTFIIALEHSYRPLRRILSEVRDSEIYKAAA